MSSEAAPGPGGGSAVGAVSGAVQAGATRTAGWSAWLVLAGALAVAIVLRFEYLRELLSSPFGRSLLLDAEWFDQAARRVAAGGELRGAEAYFRPPLYTLFLAGVYRLFGETLLVPRIAQMALGLVHVVLCWRIAALTHGRVVAGVTAFLAAGYGMFIYFEGEILATALGTLLSTTAVLLLLEGDRRGSFFWSFGGGVAIGLASLAHGTALVLAPAAILWAVFRGARARLGARLVPPIAIVTGLALPVGIVTARNLAVSGELVLVATQGGINFFIGNNESADGKSALAPGFAEAAQVVMDDGRYRDTMEVAARVLAERGTGRSLTAAQVDRYWWSQAFEWVRDHPRDAVALYLRKIVFFWSGFEISNNRDLRDQALRFTPILRLFLGHAVLILPFAMFGAIRGSGAPPPEWAEERHRRRRARALLFLFLVFYSAAIAAFFVCARFRQPAIAWLLPFAAAGFVGLFRDFAHFEPRRLLGSLAILAVFFAATNARMLTRAGIADVTVAKDAPFHRYNLAVLFERAGNLDRAIEEYRAVAATGLPDPRVHLNLGNALARTGRGAEARDEYRTALRIAPDFETAVRSNLGILATQEGNWMEAIRQFETCLELDPGHRQALVGLASSYLAAGRFDDAINAHRRALEAGVEPRTTLRRSLAVAYLEAGLLADAEREALAALEDAPGDVVTVLTLGKIYASQGEADAAERMWERARELAPGAPPVERAIEDAKNRLP